MPLLASEGESKPKQQPPAGTHVGRCYSVIDLGTQPGTFGSKRKVRITWELPDEVAVFNADAGEQPFVISREYTLSLYEKANLRHDLESWRGQQFTEAELKGFDIFTLVGVPCMLTIIHKTKEGKTYANVTGVSKMAKGMTASKQVNPSVQYSIDEGANDTFRKLPEWLRKKIEQAEEWNGGSPTTDEEPERDPFDEDGDGEECPF